MDARGDTPGNPFAAGPASGEATAEGRLIDGRVFCRVCEGKFGKATLLGVVDEHGFGPVVRGRSPKGHWGERLPRRYIGDRRTGGFSHRCGRCDRTLEGRTDRLWAAAQAVGGDLYI